MASADVYEQRLCHFFSDVWSPAISKFYWTVSGEGKTAYGDQK
jgi:hypothetical protein